jgi:hypothetical protein
LIFLLSRRRAEEGGRCRRRRRKGERGKGEWNGKWKRKWRREEKKKRKFLFYNKLLDYSGLENAYLSTIYITYFVINVISTYLCVVHTSLAIK